MFVVSLRALIGFCRESYEQETLAKTESFPFVTKGIGLLEESQSILAFNGFAKIYLGDRNTVSIHC